MMDERVRAVCDLPQLPQSQDSLVEQLSLLSLTAIRLGLYDADDRIKQILRDQNGPW